MIRITSQLASALRGYAFRATHQAYRNAGAKINNHKVTPSQKEAWHVAQLCASIRSLAQDWRRELTAELPNLTMSMSSVFTHQKPYVQSPKRLKGNPRCELADLLVAVIDRRANPGKGWAILVQAKLSGNEQVTLSTTSEQTQFKLLSQRLIFDVDADLSPAQVDLKGELPDSALLYGLASEHAHFHYPYHGCCQYWTWLMADALGRLPQVRPYHVTATEPFSSVLVGLLQGNYGWEFNLPPHGQNWEYFCASSQRHDWSMLINYLLEDTFKGDMSKKLQVPAEQTSRGKEEQLYFEAQTPRNASMFCITDGFSQLIQLSTSTSGKLEGPVWIPSNPDIANGDDGGDGGGGNNFDGPEDGAISAMVIEIGEKS